MNDLLYPLRGLHGRIHEWRIRMLPVYLGCLRKKKYVLLIFTPEHGNLGDHAIAESEGMLLKELGIPYVEISEYKLRYLQKRRLLGIMNGSKILVHGGGYLGTLWFSCELLLRDIIRKNPKSRMLCLPNTIFYEKDDWGTEESRKSIQIYNKHSHLKLYAREYYSFNIMSEMYKNVGIAPDMVLRMNKCQPGAKRNGCVLCLRNDSERTMKDEEMNYLKGKVNELFNGNVSYHDMLKPYLISINDRQIELEKQYDIFRHAELVVTDRLHGMIFSAITGTPCIVINSKSPKVKGCFEWIKDLGYIYFCDDLMKIDEIYRGIPKKEWQYNNERLNNYFEQLKHDIEQLFG